MMSQHIFSRVTPAFRTLGAGTVDRMSASASGNIWLAGNGYEIGELSYHILQRRWNGARWVKHDYNGRVGGLYDIYQIEPDQLLYFENSWNYLFNGAIWSDQFKAGDYDNGVGGVFTGTGLDIRLFVGGTVAGGFLPGVAYWFIYSGSWTLYSQVVGSADYPYYYYYPVDAALSATGSDWVTYNVYSPTASHTSYAVGHRTGSNSLTIDLTSEDYRFQSIAAVSDTEVYIARYSNSPTSGTDDVVLYNGSSVTPLGLSVVRPNFRMVDIAVSPGGTLWASGDDPGFGISGVATMLRYNGSYGDWTSVSLPYVYSHPYDQSFAGPIAIIAANDIWVGGSESYFDGRGIPMTWHYNGSRWTAHPVYPSLP